ncbi:MAG TPA: integrase family protein [Thermoanaerobaculia bacterium]|nr:integrase family protein [Thermoanaerobaculia bacterium]
MPRQAKLLTKARLDALRKRAEADPKFSTFTADAGQRGLYVWVRPVDTSGALGLSRRQGRLRFVCAYRPPAGGARRRIQIGDYGDLTLDQARKATAAMLADVAAGRDPVAVRDREAAENTTFKAAAAAYLADLLARAEGGAKRGRRSSHATAKGYLDRWVLPRIGAKRARDVTEDDVKAVVGAIGKKKAPTVNRVLAVTSAVFNFAERRGWVPPRHNPTRGVVRLDETGKRRKLEDHEMIALGAALREAEEAGSVPKVGKDGKPVTRKTAAGELEPVRVKVALVAVRAVKLLALTGLRRSELLGHSAKARRGALEGLRWGDVDLERGTVTLREAKTERNQIRVIGRPAIEVLEEMKPAKAGKTNPVCPGDVAGAPFVGIDKARVALYRAAGIEGADLHSLRHSFASKAAHVQSGRFAAFASALLGHGATRRTITNLYIHGDPEALRPAADAIAGAIEKLLDEKRGKVLEFPAAGVEP